MARAAYGERAYRDMAAALTTAADRGMGVPCWRGCGRAATSPDHVPALARHDHQAGSGCCTLVPSCLPCQRTQGARIRNTRTRTRATASRRW